MDLNKFQSLSINKNSPLRRLRNRNIYFNVTVTTIASSTNKDSQSLSETSSTISSASSFNVSAQCSGECKSNSSVSVHNEVFESSDENDDNEGSLVQYSSDGRDSNQSDDGSDDEKQSERRELTLVETQRRCRKLYYEGYFYTIDGSSRKAVGPNDRVNWKCERTGSNHESNPE